MAELEIQPSPAMRLRVTGLVVTGVAISLVLVFLLSGGGSEIFATKTTLLTYLPNAAGITNVSPVRLNGIEIGRVGKVNLSPELNPQKAVRVEMIVKRRFLKDIPADSTTSVTADNLVGDKLVSISSGKSPIVVAEGGELPTEPLNQAIDRADLLRTLERNLQGIDVLLQQVSSPDTDLGKLVLTENYYKTLLSRVTEFDRGVHALIRPQTDLGKAFYTMDLYHQLSDPLTKFDAQLESLQKGEGPAGQMLVSDEQYNRLLKGFQDLRSALMEANAGRGPLGKALKTDEDYRNIQRLLRSTDATIASLTAGDTQLAELLRNPQLYESLSGSLRSMQLVLQDLESNPKKYLRLKVF